MKEMCEHGGSPESCRNIIIQEVNDKLGKIEEQVDQLHEVFYQNGFNGRVIKLETEVGTLQVLPGKIDSLEEKTSVMEGSSRVMNKLMWTILGFVVFTCLTVVWDQFSKPASGNDKKEITAIVKEVEMPVATFLDNQLELVSSEVKLKEIKAPVITLQGIN